MIYPEGTTYNKNDTVDINHTLELSATFDTFQEFLNYLFGVEAIKLAISRNKLNLNINKKQQINIFVEKVDTL
jgi:hypothetical protein